MLSDTRTKMIPTHGSFLRANPNPRLITHDKSASLVVGHFLPRLEGPPKTRGLGAFAYRKQTTRSLTQLISTKFFAKTLEIDGMKKRKRKSHSTTTDKHALTRNTALYARASLMPSLRPSSSSRRASPAARGPPFLPRPFNRSTSASAVCGTVPRSSAPS